MRTKQLINEIKAPKALLYIIIVYLISHGIFLLINDVWWDDYCIWNVTDDYYYKLSGPESFNNPILYKYHTTINHLPYLYSQITIYHIISFICGLISIISMWLIMNRICKNKHLVLSIILLAASCGINQSQFLICCTHYMFANTLFLIGLVYFVYDFYEENIMKKILNILFWFSSIIIWKSAITLIPLCLFIACFVSIKKRWKDLKTYMLLIKNIFYRYWYILITLVIYVTIYLLFLTPKGNYSDYYTISLKYVILSPIISIIASIKLLISYLCCIFEVSINSKSILWFSFTLILGAVIYLLLKKQIFQNNYKMNKRDIIIAFIFISFSIIPQIVIGKIIWFIPIDDYNSRFASLSILPLSYLIICIINNSIKYKTLIYSLILASSITYSISVNFDYIRKSIKSQAIENYLKNHNELKDKVIQIFDNNPLSHYEYEGIARKAYGKENNTKFVIPEKKRIWGEVINSYDYIMNIKTDEIPSSIVVQYLISRNTIFNNIIHISVNALN